MSDRADPVALLEFGFDDRSYPFIAASGGGAESVLEETLPRTDGAYGEFVSVRGRDPEEVLAMVDGAVGSDPLVDRGPADSWSSSSTATVRRSPSPRRARCREPRFPPMATRAPSPTAS